MAWNSLLDFIHDPTTSTDCLGVYLKRTCSRVTTAFSALAVLNDYALYKSTHSLTHNRQIAVRCYVSRVPVLSLAWCKAWSQAAGVVGFKQFCTIFPLIWCLCGLHIIFKTPHKLTCVASSTKWNEQVTLASISSSGVCVVWCRMVGRRSSRPRISVSWRSCKSCW